MFPSPREPAAIQLADEAPDAASVRPKVAPPAPIPVRPRPVPASSASILALTEDLEVRDLLFELAVSEGFGLRCATTELEAANLIHAERPGLVLIDLDMESRTGLKFLRTLRQSPYRDLPCLAVTASNDPMLSVSVDAPVYFKPALDGLPAALENLFRR